MLSIHWKTDVLWRKPHSQPKVFKITQGSEITQAKFQKITQPTGGFGHSQPPKKCRKKKPELNWEFLF